MPTQGGRGRGGRPWRKVTARIRALGLPCWLCGKAIDYTLPAGHPDAFTTDHVVAQSTLDPDDPLLLDPANLRPAHRKCNSSRGNGRRKAEPQTRKWY